MKYMTTKNLIILAIIIAGCIFYYDMHVERKIETDEKQARMASYIEREKISLQKEIEETKRIDETTRILAHMKCNDDAEKDAFEYLKINGTYNEENGSVNASNYVSSKAEEKESEDKKRCNEMFGDWN